MLADSNEFAFVGQFKHYRPMKKKSLIFSPIVSGSLASLIEKAEAQALESQDAAVAFLGSPTVILFSVKNNRVKYVIHDAAEMVGVPKFRECVIRAVAEYEVAPLERKPETIEGVTYDQCVKIDWAKKLLTTNFPPEQGEVFLRAMALVVEGLQGPTVKLPAPESKPS